MPQLPLAGADHAHGAVLIVYHHLVAEGIAFARQHAGKGASGQLLLGLIGHAAHFKQGGHEIIVAHHGLADHALGDVPRPGKDARHLDAGFIHVHGIGAVALAHDAVMAHVAAVIAGEHDHRAVQQAVGLQPVEDAAHVRIHGRDRRVIAALALAAVGQPGFADGRVIGMDKADAGMRLLFPIGKGDIAIGHPGVDILKGDGIEGAVAIQLVILLGMAFLRPGGMRRGKVHSQAEGLLLIADIQEAQGVIGNVVGHIAVALHGHFAVFQHNGEHIVFAAVGRGAPIGKPGLGGKAIAHVPLAGQAALVARIGQIIGKGVLAAQIVDGAVALEGYARPDVLKRGILHAEALAQLLGQHAFIQQPLGQPIVHAVLGGNLPGIDAHARGRADGRHAKQVFHAHAHGGQTIQIGGVDFAVAGAVHGPCAHIVGHDEKQVGVLRGFRHSLCLRSFLLF